MMVTNSPFSIPRETFDRAVKRRFQNSRSTMSAWSCYLRIFTNQLFTSLFEIL